MNQASEALVQRQQDLEQEMAGLGIERYRKLVAKARKKNQESSLDYGQLILRRAVVPMSEAINEFLAAAASGKAGRRHTAAAYLNLTDTDVASYLTCRTILDHISNKTPFQSVCVKLGHAIEDEVRFRIFSKKTPGLFRAVLKDLHQRTSNRDWQRKVLVHTMNKYDVKFEGWPERDVYLLGEKLVDLFIQSTGLVKVERRRANRSNTLVYLVPGEDTEELITKQCDRGEIMSPALLPTVIPPKPWTSVYTGGYHFTPVNRPLVKTRNRNYLEELRNRADDMPGVYAAVNAVQATAWKINTQVLEVAREVWERSLPFGKMPMGEKLELPAKPKDIATNEASRIAWKRKAVRVHTANAKRESKRFQATQIIDLAFKFQDDKAIAFPHQLDFRGRMYPLPMFLNPQGNDLAKGLLTFANGKPIDDARALGWLMIHGANCFGEDKVSLEERVGWVAENEERIIRTAQDPLADPWWSEADKPWMFLAFCFEYSNFQLEGFGYVSSLPIMLDGSCNGLQHFAAMLRDEKGGAEVNLVPSEKPADIYQTVADRVVEKLCHFSKRADVCHCGGDLVTRSGCMGAACTPMATNEDMVKINFAVQWLAFGITRKTTKRAVMIVPYSGTRYACRSYIEEHVLDRLEEGEVSPFDEDLFAATKFLANLVWSTINETVVSAREAMNWLQTAAKLVAAEGLPITWVTPDGFPVFQAYPEVESRRIKATLGDGIIRVTLTEETGELSKKKQASGISPNFVHSMDATALRMYVNIAADNGVQSFAVVHDSFGVCAADTDMSAACLRHAFVDMYLEHNVLIELQEELAALLPGGADALPPMPKRGNLEIETVRDAEYFFA